jgi:hypothetical protein
MHLTKPAVARLATIAILSITLAATGCKSAPPPPDDTAVNTALQAKLTGDTAIAAEPIQTFVQAGVATLQGTVSSEAAKALAASDASQVPGVKSVVNQLAVATAQAAPPPAPAAPTASPAPAPAPTRPGKPSAALQRPASRPAPPPVAQYNPPSQPAPVERHAMESTPQPEQHPPAPPPPPPAPRNVSLPSGTTLPVRITQTLDSATAQEGDSFSGTIASDILVDGVVAVPAGTTVTGRLEQVHEAGHFKGSALLTLTLVTLNQRGDNAAITTEPYTQQGKGRGTNTAEKVGGGAAVGAILGGIFGGGKGAAIGGLAGGGLGAGAQGVTRGQQVQIPSETLIRFHLTAPVEVRTPITRAPQGDANLQPRNSN